MLKGGIPVKFKKSKIKLHFKKILDVKYFKLNTYNLVTPFKLNNNKIKLNNIKT